MKLFKWAVGVALVIILMLYAIGNIPNLYFRTTQIADINSQSQVIPFKRSRSNMFHLLLGKRNDVKWNDYGAVKMSIVDGSRVLWTKTGPAKELEETSWVNSEAITGYRLYTDPSNELERGHSYNLKLEFDTIPRGMTVWIGDTRP